MPAIAPPYGKLHQEIWVENQKGKQVRVEIQHPWAMLYYAAMMSEGLSKLLQQMERSTSFSNPVQVVFYGDEVHPGNPLANTHGRKIWAFYWTLLNFGGAAMSDEDACMGVYTCAVRATCTCAAAQMLSELQHPKDEHK